MNYYGKRTLKRLSIIASAATLVFAGCASAVESSETHQHVDPTGIGACHKVDDNWLPPNGMGPGTFTGWIGHPCPQPRPNHGHYFGSAQTQSEDGVTTYVVTPEGASEPQSPFDEAPGSNFLKTIDNNLYDFNGDEMPNTQPSRLGSSKYLLHDGPVRSHRINPKSPSNDLNTIINLLEKSAERKGLVDGRYVDIAVDILEGNPIRGRAYSGYPMLHYNGPNKYKKVVPIFDKNGKKIGGNVDVGMIYFDQHIESNVSLIDVTEVQDVPWTITYRVNILNGGIEDFSPMVSLRDQNPDGTPGPLLAGMDQTYFPMLETGTRYTIKIKETLGKYYNLTYTWGWRIHPPRVQVTENATKVVGPMTTLQHEQTVFGLDPQGSEENKLAAIAMIGELSPAKRMWNQFRALRAKSEHNRYFVDKDELKQVASDLRAAYMDWMDRTKLPAGVTADPNATLTMLYVNNTLYGSRQGITGSGLSGDDSGQGPAAFKGVCNGCAHDWNKRPYNYKVTLYNGDHFPHGYVNVDFGGTRGWENQFQDTDPTTALAEETHTEMTTIEGSRFDVEDHVLLDNTYNPNKYALRDVPDTMNNGEGVDLIYGDQVEEGVTEVTTNDRVFPTNTGGMEEFLQPTPRKLLANGKIDNNAKQQFGSGCFFTFGRNYTWPNAGGPWGAIIVPPVSSETGEPGMHKVEITYNFEPSRRLKIYQFDPFHHDVAVYSLH